MKTVVMSEHGPVHALKQFGRGHLKYGLLETLCGKFPKKDEDVTENRNVTCSQCDRVLVARGIADYAKGES